MKTSSKMVMLVVAFTLNLDFSLLASEITHEFKNPAFSGNGYSSHVLSINQLEVQREQGVIDDLKSAKAAAERAEKNKTVNKFIANVESRIYSTLSRQIVEEMFGENPSDEGSFEVDGTGITYVKDNDEVELTITDEYGKVTVITVPLGDFGL